MLFSLLKHYLEFYITDATVTFPVLCAVSLLLYLMVLKTISQGCGVTGISDAILMFFTWP